MADNPTPAGPDRQTVTRFWTLNAVRLAGLALVLVGISALGERVEMPRWAAGAFLFVGVGVFFFLPFALARRWKADK